MTKVLLKITLFDPKATGNSPANGIIEAAPSLRRHIDDETPADFIVLPARCTARLGDALTYTDNDDIEQTAEATPGVAWFWIDATTDGDYADLWYWSFLERTSGGKRRYCKVPATSPVDYGDLVDVDPDTYVEVDPGVPGWAAPLAAEVARAEAAESDLQEQIDAVEAGDVDSVAGLTGTVTASALKTALSLPTNAASDITTNATAIATETTRATTAEGLLDGRLESAEGTIAALPATYAPIAVVAELDELERSKSWAKNPDTLVVGAATYASGLLVTAAVVWPDAATGVLTITSRQSGTDAVTGYTITHVVGPTTLTYTQPTITRDVDGNATSVPQITVA